MMIFQLILQLKYWKRLTITALSLSFLGCGVIPDSIKAENPPQSGEIKQKRNKLIFTLSGHTASVTTLDISPDGKTLVSGAADNTVKVWDLKNGELIQNFQDHQNRITSVAISPSGKILASGSDDKTIKIWDLQTGKLISTIDAHKARLNAIVISPDGKILISGSDDKTIKIWDLQTQKLKRTFKADTTSLTISSDGKTLFSGNQDGTITLFDITTGKSSQKLTPPLPKDPTYEFQKASAVSSLAVSNDGKILVNSGYDDSHMSIQETDGKNIKVWNLQTGELLHNFSVGIGGIDAVAISPDGKTFASGGHTYEISLWDINTGKRLNTLSAKQGGVSAIAFSKDGKFLVSSSGNRSIKVWLLN